jgi:hypothetical protein
MADGKNTTNGSETTSKTEGNGHLGNGGADDLMSQVGIEDPPIPDRPEQNPSKPTPEQWPDPEPLEPPLAEQTAFPLDALPGLAADAVAEYQPFGQQPAALIAGSALATVSLVCQPFADVARDPLLTGPIGLSIMTIGRSGERKTMADRHFTRAATKWLHDRRLARSQNDRELFLFYHDVTPEKLATALYERWPSAGQFSDEGAIVIGSHAVTETAMRYFGLLNRLWDGSPFSRERQTGGGSVYLAGRRFTVHLAMQPVVLRDLLAVGDGLARAVGWLSRFLISWPQSALGTQVYREPPTRTPALDAYNGRVLELLEGQLDKGRFRVVPGDLSMALDPPLLSFDRHAKQCWREYHDEVARQLGEDGCYGEIADVGAKSPENVARLAANHHVFEGGDAPGEIGENIMQKAVRLGRWYLDEARRALGVGETAQVYADGLLLSRWAYRNRKVSSFPAREVLRAAPAPLRNTERRDAALALLVEANHLRPRTRRGRTIYYINPKLFTLYGKGPEGLVGSNGG